MHVLGLLRGILSRDMWTIEDADRWLTAPLDPTVEFGGEFCGVTSGRFDGSFSNISEARFDGCYCFARYG